jgi:hypothetical protein
LYPVYGESAGAAVGYHTLFVAPRGDDRSDKECDSAEDGDEAARPSASNRDGVKFLPPEDDLSEGLLDDRFVRCLGQASAKGQGDAPFLERLGVKRLSLARLFLDHLLPRLDPDAANDAAAKAGIKLARSKPGSIFKQKKKRRVFNKEHS